MFYRRQQFIKRETIGDEVRQYVVGAAFGLMLGFGICIWVFVAGHVCTVPSPSHQDLNR